MTTRQSHKRRASKWEIDLNKWFRNLGHAAERLARAGSKDEGDLVVVISGTTFIVEAKAPGESGRINLSQWTQEAKIEKQHYGQARNIPLESIQSIVAIKARGKSIDDAYVVMPLNEFERLICKLSTDQTS